YGTAQRLGVEYDTVGVIVFFNKALQFSGCLGDTFVDDFPFALVAVVLTLEDLFAERYRMVPIEEQSGNTYEEREAQADAGISQETLTIMNYRCIAAWLVVIIEICLCHQSSD